MYLSISATTREPRANEVDRNNYHFIAQQEFENLIKEAKFLELARVHDFMYGTLQDEVENKLKEGLSVILEIDPQGAQQVREKRPDAVLVFIKTPSMQELEKRLRGRKTDSEEVIKKRLGDAKHELEQVSKYDYVIINDYIEKASKELAKVVEGETK